MVEEMCFWFADKGLKNKSSNLLASTVSVTKLLTVFR